MSGMESCPWRGFGFCCDNHGSGVFFFLNMVVVVFYLKYIKIIFIYVLKIIFDISASK